MRVYKLTKLGKDVVRNSSGTAEELRVLEYIWNNGTATDDQLEVVGERYMIRDMKQKGLVKELTQE